MDLFIQDFEYLRNSQFSVCHVLLHNRLPVSEGFS
jgi:hypothetical protein